MSLSNRKKSSKSGKVILFRSFFTGLTDVYGTYDPATGRSWQVKKTVSDETILSHLKGIHPYGVYLLDGCITRAIAADFDTPDPFPPVEFLNAARHYLLPAYIETSKSKGFHVWIFFDEMGVQAAKARMIVKQILDEIGHPNVEIFPKQDYMDKNLSFGNFINAPLFGALVPYGKTVFVDPSTLNPHPDQWAFLSSVNRVSEDMLDEIIDLNNLTVPQVDDEHVEDSPQPNGSNTNGGAGFGLPPCARRMLQEGVTQYQRVVCFRLAVHLKRLGFPYDVALSALKAWALKNRPHGDKRILTEREIMDQTSYAFKSNYR